MNVQKQGNIKTYCDFGDLWAQPIDEICLFSVMTVYNTRKATLLQSLTNTIIHYMYQVFATFNTMKQHSYEKKTFKPSIFRRSIQLGLKFSKGHIFFS